MVPIYLKSRADERVSQRYRNPTSALRTSSGISSVDGSEGQASPSRRSSTHSRSSERSNRLSRAFATQTMYYVLALYAVYIPTFVRSLVLEITRKNYFSLRLLMTIFIPLQGVFNALVYHRIRYLERLRKTKRERSVSQLKIKLKVLANAVSAGAEDGFDGSGSGSGSCSVDPEEGKLSDTDPRTSTAHETEEP